MTIKVEFARDDNSVNVLHGYVGTFTNEDLNKNIKHGKVVSTNMVGDKNTLMTPEEYVQVRKRTMF